MIKKVLIANRGEIALRIIHACKELGIKTVAVHSEADEHSLHVRFADEDVCIGPASSGESYLNIPRIISAAEISNADAIHPGYGFLAENAKFAEVCEDHNIIFIGPSSDSIRKMGDKTLARAVMIKAGIPVVPGSFILNNIREAKENANRIGYPVIIKAVAGGGGRGMRVVWQEEYLEENFDLARQEAKSFFARADVYIEKYIISPRHIEFQIIGDKFGNIIHLGERECSIQRRHQKLLEEAPSPGITPEIREKMGNIIVEGLKKIAYFSVGTMEFIMDAEKNLYFMEMNTRIQVEHPVTEQITGVDLVKEQILIASGEKLQYKQEDIKWTGHSIECRINAEDPDRNFIPSPGTIKDFHIPGGPGIRIDTHIYSGCVIPKDYDSMIMKLISYGRNRTEAIARMKRALEECFIEGLGIKTTIPLHLKILENKDFIRGEINTNFLNEKLHY